MKKRAEICSWFTGACLSSGTARVYGALLAGFFRTAGEESLTDGTFERKAIAYDADMAASSRHSFRAALRLFLRNWNSGGRGVLSVTFPRISQQEAEVLEPPIGALRQIAARVPANHLSRMRWGDARQSQDPGVAELRCPDVFACYFVPAGAARALGLWAGNGSRPKPEQPIIPRRPGDLVPMRATRIRTLVKDRPRE